MEKTRFNFIPDGFTDKPSKGMQYWIDKGRYEIIGTTFDTPVTIHTKRARLIAVYTSRKTQDINIYKTRGRRSAPFILVSNSDSSAYCWRVPVTIYDNK